MAMKNDRILDIVNVKDDEDYQRIRDELIRIGGMFSILDELKDQDVERIISESFTPAGRFVILSPTLFPQLCEILGRGLTLEEIGFIIGVDQTEIKTILKRKKIRDAGNFTISSVKKADYNKILLPLKGTIEYADGTTTKDVILKEPLLAPVHLVSEIRLKGYRTKEGRVLRQGYLTIISGPLPSIYSFQRGNKIRNEARQDIENKIELDSGAIKASNDIVITQLRFIRAIINHDMSQEYFSQMATFFHDTYQNTIHYAWRFRSLNDDATFDKIERLAMPFLVASDNIIRFNWINDFESRRMFIDMINEILDEIKQDTPK